MVLTDGDAHTVDSNEMAFRRASVEAFRSAMLRPEAKVHDPFCLVWFCSLRIVLSRQLSWNP
jgi:translation elongation factor EF-G